ncbi:MAG TPA: hypothetical protein IAB40_07365 [Candidatus Onthocola stercoravium]|nr:hypothetical protein [Candidatus Onthocola stercoravium]
MKKYILLICMFFITGFILLFNRNEEKIIYTNSKSEQIIDSNALTMMYETDYNSGEYQVSSDTTWPQEGYIFNENLSACENGSTLTWDNENKRIVMQANTSDKCYIYFDKYKYSTIDNVVTSATQNSITVNVEATPGDGTIVSYHYSINNGEYVTSNNSSYTFNNLTSNTAYSINVYVTDSNGKVSSEYTTSQNTSYVNPTVNSVTTSSTKDTISINVNASGGSGNIVTYHYSINNGSTYTASSNSNYTFTGLTSNTTYNIKVYVTDSNGITSNIYSTSEITKLGLISFSISGTSYNAEEGMTWEEWVVSDYNTDKDVIGCAQDALYHLSSGSFSGPGGGYPIYSSGVYTICTSEISTEENYYYDTSGLPDMWR